MGKMTWDELVDIYGKWELQLQSGYKHSFTYLSEELNGMCIQATVGDGDPSSVYKVRIEPYSFLEHMTPVAVSILSDGKWHEVYEV